jgi:SAM-dependent methyltransferase
MVRETNIVRHENVALLFSRILRVMRMTDLSLAGFTKLARRGVRWLAKNAPSPIGRHISGRLWTPRVGAARFGDFARTVPISDVFGFDRGIPIDRYYIENFLEKSAKQIRGRVLEIGDKDYTVRFGGNNVDKSDVLHVDDGNSCATIIGDLSNSGVLPPDAFDCIVLTQTLHLIFDMRNAVAELAKSLKPGGTLLITVPGITRVDREEWGYTWYWSLTGLALTRLLAEFFEEKDIVVETFGNVFAAVCFLEGLAVSEVPTPKLDVLDPSFPVIVTAKVVKRPC